MCVPERRREALVAAEAGGGVGVGEGEVLIFELVMEDLDTGGVDVFIFIIEWRFFVAVVDEELGVVREPSAFLLSSRYDRKSGII